MGNRQVTDQEVKNTEADAEEKKDLERQQLEMAGLLSIRPEVRRALYELNRNDPEQQAVERTETYMWHSCCGNDVDRRVVQYITMSVMIAIVLGFCIFQLAVKDDCNSQQTYLGLMTFLFGLMLPNPKIWKPSN